MTSDPERRNPQTQSPIPNPQSPLSPSQAWTVGRLLQWTADYLKRHGADSPRLDAEVLLAETLRCPRIALYTTFDQEPDEKVRSAFRDLVRRRAEGTPVAYLVGHREFFSMDFRVTPDVLIPRPETELLVMTLIELARRTGGRGRGTGGARRGAVDAGMDEGGGIRNETDRPDSSPIPRPPSPISHPPSSVQLVTICDVGTGSGIIAVAAAKHLPNSRVTAIDISPAALAVARGNAETHGLLDRIEFLQSDLFAALPTERRFDFIASNPPYVTEGEFEKLAPDVRRFEPRLALVSGSRGTEVIEPLLTQAAERLNPGGHVLIEISPMIHDAVRTLLAADGQWEVGPTVKDLNRLPRVVQAKRRDDG